MKCSEFPYSRPDMDAACKFIDNLTAEFAKTTTLEEQIKIIYSFRDKMIEVGNMMDICYIRNTQNTNDEFYKNEQAFFDKVAPTYGNASVNFGKAIDRKSVV